jgi:AcrR family transcriptional regulator
VIAAEASANQALIFYHYGTVNGLLLAALDAVSARRMATLGVLVESATTLAALMEALEQVVTEDTRSGDLAALVALLDAGRGDAALARAVAERLAPWQALTERAIRRVVDTHLLGALVPVPVVARLAMATVLGLELLGSVPEGGGSAPNHLMATLRAAFGATATPQS